MTESRTIPRYSIGTWDEDEEAYTPQVDVPAFNLGPAALARSIRMLRDRGYSAHRHGNTEDDHYDNDTSVIVQRTDGMSPDEILEECKR